MGLGWKGSQGKVFECAVLCVCGAYSGCVCVCVCVCVCHLSIAIMEMMSRCLSFGVVEKSLFLHPPFRFQILAFFSKSSIELN